MVDLIDEETACVVVQTPDVFGHLHDLRNLAKAAQERGALLIVVVTEIISLGALMSPGEMGADIVVAEGQSIGNGLNFGGPYLGLFATKQKYIRQMPGRVCGQTIDADGKRSYVLTLSTREQHIRRDKATSNICTNSGLCCLAFTIHLALLGEKGFKQLAALNHQMTCILADRLQQLDGIKVLNKTFFNELTIRVNGNVDSIVNKLAGQNILAGVPALRLWPSDQQLDDVLILSATETVTPHHIDQLITGLKEGV